MIFPMLRRRLLRLLLTAPRVLYQRLKSNGGRAVGYQEELLNGSLGWGLLIFDRQSADGRTDGTIMMESGSLNMC